MFFAMTHELSALFKIAKYQISTLVMLMLFAPSIQAVNQTLLVEQVELLNSPVLRNLDALVEAVHQATVSSQVAGRIISIPVDVDDYVEKGGIIVQFRDKEIRAAYDSANAKLKAAQLSYNRIQDIYEKNLVSKSALDQSEASLKSAIAKVQQAQEALENTIVRAPYSGIVVKRLVEVGESVQVGTKLMTGLSLETLRATTQIPQEIIHAVRKRKKAWVYVGENKDQRVAVTSMSISPYADPVSHTFLVQLYLPKGDHKIYPGMYTKVSFSVDEKESLVISKRAIAYRSEVIAVYVRNKNGSLSFRQIRLGQDVGADQIEVSAGLSQGEEIVQDPIQAAVQIKYQN
ncbi:MAG: efflux RND transporter periplasmic adaptor subunit [Thiohalomonadales bacterium]